MRRTLGVGLVLVVCAVSLGRAARASDGVLEISHTCATTTGCFAGDAPGYPVTVTAPGSYRLTSNLTVPANTNGIDVGNGIDIDLGGFEIAGPVSCSPGCPGVGTGSGIAALLFGGNQCAVSNGKVRGFAEDGIRLGFQAEVRRVRVNDVARHGLFLGGGSLAAENLVTRIGQNGMRFTISSIAAAALYRDNTISSTGQQSVVEGRASGPNTCTDQLCGTSGAKFFYLTTSTSNGAAADAACVVGFHMASLGELLDTSALEYDTTRGRAQADSGQGAPSSGFGWVRTGYVSSTGNVGQGNCATWTSSSINDSGSSVAPRSVWLTTVLHPTEPWEALSQTCNTPLPVWCLQD